MSRPLEIFTNKTSLDSNKSSSSFIPVLFYNSSSQKRLIFSKLFLLINFNSKSSSAGVRTDQWYKYIPISGVTTSNTTLREKCPYSDFFYSVFSCIRTRYTVIVQMRENSSKKNSEYGYLLRSVSHHQLLYALINGKNI